MNRELIVVSFANTDRYKRGMARLYTHVTRLHPGIKVFALSDELPTWRKHRDYPYAFKAHAIGFALAYCKIVQPDQLPPIVLWADACILPVRDLAPIVQHAVTHGAWIANNGYTNYEWTADAAYPCIWPGFGGGALSDEHRLQELRAINKRIKHVVATAFAFDPLHEVGASIWEFYHTICLQTDALKGPWWNRANPQRGQLPGAEVCGPADVQGHRHDQTVLSVAAWNRSLVLTECPQFFAYPPAGWKASDPLAGLDERTILLAEGGYE